MFGGFVPINPQRREEFHAACTLPELLPQPAASRASRRKRSSSASAQLVIIGLRSRQNRPVDPAVQSSAKTEWECSKKQREAKAEWTKYRASSYQRLADTEESLYADFARLCALSAPPLAERIYSITFMSRADEWTATVGRQLRGISRPRTRSRSRKVGQVQHLTDPAMVLAIFPGTPFKVVTNHLLPGRVGLLWENPFLAGEPRSITYFRC